MASGMPSDGIWISLNLGVFFTLKTKFNPKSGTYSMDYRPIFRTGAGIAS
jgi:hypothetical protein